MYKLTDEQRKRIKADVYCDSPEEIIDFIQEELAPQIRNDALEEAAKICDMEQDKPDGSSEGYERACAIKIRVLKNVA